MVIKTIVVAALLGIVNVIASAQTVANPPQPDPVYQFLPDEPTISPCPESDKYLENGQSNEAIVALSQCILKKPNDVPLYLMRGNVWMMTGNKEKAWEDFDQAVRLDPKSSKAFELRGMVDIERGNNDQGLNDLDQAIRLAPEKQQLLVQKGNVLFFLQRYQQAIAIFTDVIQTSPQFFAGYVNRANVYETIEEYSKAISDYDKAISLEPELPPLRFARGMVLFYLGQFEKALKDFTHVYNNLKNDEIGLMVALALNRTEKKEDAKNLLKELLENALPSNKPIIHKLLGELADEEFILMAGEDFERQSVYWGFLGQYYVAEENSQKAEESFQRSVELDTLCKNIPCRFSRAELSRMK